MKTETNQRNKNKFTYVVNKKYNYLLHKMSKVMIATEQRKDHQVSVSLLWKETIGWKRIPYTHTYFLHTQLYLLNYL